MIFPGDPPGVLDPVKIYRSPALIYNALSAGQAAIKRERRWPVDGGEIP
jgi:hypothetical protein